MAASRDRWGRARLLPVGPGISGLFAVALALSVALPAAALFVTTLSLGYDMTQPLLAGIVTDLGPARGVAMGLNVFCCSPASALTVWHSVPRCLSDSRVHSPYSAASHSSLRQWPLGYSSRDATTLLKAP